MSLVTAVYRSTASFPPEELYGLSSQMRRSAVSVPSNIAEGAARNSKKEFAQFLHIAVGSLAELETQVLISENLRYIRGDKLLTEIDAVRRMCKGLLNSLKSE